MKCTELRKQALAATLSYNIIHTALPGSQKPHSGVAVAHGGGGVCTHYPEYIAIMTIYGKICKLVLKGQVKLLNHTKYHLALTYFLKCEIPLSSKYEVVL